ncbi:heavy metal-binding domain-containing protein [Flavobacterium sp. SH_e]|uniref:heavy metal-binding domain-containing protein n=1 Tax=Flavobacterium sp. SH_e TaxID=2983767 RepID=UPI0021E5150D|nr:heavy metal-binding domain-containing protein [Flavobacterium sp. SH_e]MCV2486513.1 heavy metal-binding domain-containing protein [Flavobacterium sp. SH_e]
MKLEKCPCCGKSLTGFFSTVNLVPQTKIDFINRHLNQNFDAYCTGCSPDLLNKLARTFQQQKNDIENRLRQIIHYIPILSSPAPNDWKYEAIDMITAQTTSGTGFATELSRSFNDFFGGTSNTTNKKILNATNLCKADIRIQCVKMGGNAIISTDIDYNEIGSGSTNMLMVCMAGTAIKVLDINMFPEKIREYILEAIELTEKLEAIADIPK